MNSVLGSILSSCQSQTPACSKGACQHGGACREGWNRATCDCTQLAYTGSACQRAASVLYLTGHEYMRLAPPSAQADIEADDINIRYFFTSEDDDDGTWCVRDVPFGDGEI